MDRMRMYYTCTIAPGRKRCCIFSKISFCNTSHATVRSKYRMKGLPHLQGSQKEFNLHQFHWWYHPCENTLPPPLIVNVTRVAQYLRPCCPAQALLHTSRTIFSVCPLFLLGLWGGVAGSCICVDILLSVQPYFRLFWLRFACVLPER